MTLLIGSLTLGLILALLAFGIVISFRVVGFEDLTVDGAITVGGAATASLITVGVHPLVATSAGLLAGGLAGWVTATLHTRFKINKLLAGILVMTALYSVNLRIMGKSNVPIMSEPTVMDYADRVAGLLFGAREKIDILQWETSTHDLGELVLVAMVTV